MRRAFISPFATQFPVGVFLQLGARLRLLCFVLFYAAVGVSTRTLLRSADSLHACVGSFVRPPLDRVLIATIVPRLLLFRG